MIEKVLAFAQSKGHIDEDRVNPAIWSRLKDSLPNPDDLAKRLGKRRHQPAMPYADVPALARRLGAGREVRPFLPLLRQTPIRPSPAALSFMCGPTPPTLARFRPLGPPMFDSPRIAS